MRKIKKLLTGLIVFLILVLVCSFILPQKTEATDLNDYLFLRLEASKDNGATWHNYSGTDYSGGETITVNPGDTVKIKFTIWNADTEYISSLNNEVTGTLTNSSYITLPEATIEDDADENGVAISGVVNTFGGTASVAELLSSGSYSSCSPVYSNCESATFSLVLSNTFPVGETIILGEAQITGHTDG